MTPVQKRLAIIAVYVVLLTLLGLFLSGVRPARVQAQRGIWFPGQSLPSALPVQLSTPLGTTVELTQYRTEVELEQALTTLQTMEISWVRQEVRWDEVESLSGQYEWGKYDRVLAAADEAGLAIVLVLNRTPEWARQADEINNPLAPPEALENFVRFAEAAALRYGDKVLAWQIWDEPNLMPHWGTEVIIDPAEYGEMLRQTTPVIRAQDPAGWVVTAGLGPTLEPGGFNMSEVRFLDGLYGAGAADYFDAVALKPYGFWTGANERLYDEAVLNFDRPVLVREVMEAHDDTATPIWLVEGGWAVLPADWQGDPPPWGSDSAAQQQPRLEEALTRTALEWQWVQLVALQPFQPDVLPTNPQVGLGLVDDNGALSALGETTSAFGNEFYQGERGIAGRTEWETVQRTAYYRWDYALWLTLGTIGLLGARLAWHLRWLPWREWGAWFRRQSDGIQIAVFAFVALLFYQIDHVVIALVLYGALGVLIAWQLQLGLAGVAFAIPFFLQVKRIASVFDGGVVVGVVCGGVGRTSHIREKPSFQRQKLGFWRRATTRVAPTDGEYLERGTGVFAAGWVGLGSIRVRGVGRGFDSVCGVFRGGSAGVSCGGAGSGAVLSGIETAGRAGNDYPLECQCACRRGGHGIAVRVVSMAFYGRYYHRRRGAPDSRTLWLP